MGQWINVAQGLPTKDRKVVFRKRPGVEYVGKYDGLVFRPDNGEWFWHPLEISDWRYEYE